MPDNSLSHNPSKVKGARLTSKQSPISYTRVVDGRAVNLTPADDEDRGDGTMIPTFANRHTPGRDAIPNRVDPDYD